MRMIDSIPHESMTIGIYQMNDRYQVRFEAGPMEQIFKFGKDDVGSLDAVKKLITPEFIERTRARFNDMFIQLRDAL
jgi:hypothetical protein